MIVHHLKHSSSTQSTEVSKIGSFTKNKFCSFFFEKKRHFSELSWGNEHCWVSVFFIVEVALYWSDVIAATCCRTHVVIVNLIPIQDQLILCHNLCNQLAPENLLLHRFISRWVYFHRFWSGLFPPAATSHMLQVNNCRNIILNWH